MSEHPALLQTDIVDSTQIGERLGDVAMSALWARHDRLARNLLNEWRGREIDKTDGFLLLFADANDAAEYAVAYHRGLAALEPPLKARAGLHVGPVLMRENSIEDVSRGAKPIEIDGVNKPITARVSSLASGDQTLLTLEAREALRGSRLTIQTHGHWQLKGLEEPLELFELGDATTSFVPPPDTEKVYRVVRKGGIWLPRREVAHSLPGERDSFVGRGSALRELRRKVEGGARLVTALGPGGIGKTRFVQRFGWSVLGDFPGGVWFCDLSTAVTLDGVLHAVAAGVRLQLGGADPSQQIANAINGRGRCLVILDNHEQVAQFSEETIGRWLQCAASAHFVVTSRSALGVIGEQIQPMDSLSLAEGVDLFANRTQAAGGRLDDSPQARSSARRLVGLLDGLPLAIELAASRMDVLSLEDVLKRMSERFRLLASTGNRTARHSTLRKTLEWSWSLLTPAERAALAQVSVFESGFSLAAFEAVVDVSAHDGDCWPLDLLQALLRKSLIRRLELDRFDLLFSIRDFAKEKLDSADAERELSRKARARHAQHYASVEPLAARRGAHRDVDNYVAACHWAIDARSLTLIPSALQVCWAALKLVGPFRVAFELSESARQALPHDDPGQAVVSWIAGSTLQLMGNVIEAERRLDSAVELACRQGDRRVEAIARCALGECQLSRGQHEDAQVNFEASSWLAAELEDVDVRLFCLNSYATFHYRRRRLSQASSLYQEAFELARCAGDKRWQGGILGNLANIEYAQGCRDRAATLYEEALAISDEERDYRWAANTRCNLGLLHHQLGRSQQGKELLETSLSEIARLGSDDLAAVVRCNLGIVCEALLLSELSMSHFEACAQGARKVADSNLLATANGYLAVQHARQGDMALATQLIGTTTIQADDSRDPLDLALLAAQRAEVALRSRDVRGDTLMADAETVARDRNLEHFPEIAAALRAARNCRVAVQEIIGRR